MNKKYVVIQVMEYYSVIKRDKLRHLYGPRVWSQSLDLEFAKLSEDRQRKTNITYMQNQKGGTNVHIYKTEAEKKKLMVTTG